VTSSTSWAHATSASNRSASRVLNVPQNHALRLVGIDAVVEPESGRAERW
jgi:hypothetical protein